MAVFPYARRALARPQRLSWLLAVLALVVGVTSLSMYALMESTSGTGWPVLSLASQPDSPVLEPSPDVPLLTSSLHHHSAERPVSEHLAPAAAADPSQRDFPAGGYVSEVSSTSAGAARTDHSVPVTAGQGLESAGEGVAGAPVVEAPAAPALVQPAGIIPADTAAIERWAAAGIIIETQSQQLDDASLANIDAALSALPAEVLAGLGNPALGPMHVLVNLEGRVLSGAQPYGGPANFFSTNEARNELVLYPQQSVFTIVHELGHAYNLRRIEAGRYAMVLLDPEMRSFLAATAWTITSTEEAIHGAVDHMQVAYRYDGSFRWPRLSNDDPLEDFANSFATYFLTPETLKQASPERYAWMLATFGQ